MKTKSRDSSGQINYFFKNKTEFSELGVSLFKFFNPSKKNKSVMKL